MSMNEQERDHARREALEYFVVGFIAFAVIIYLISKYYINVWYHSKHTLMQGLDIIPTPITKVVFFYASDAVALIPLAAEDLKHHAKDYKIYYKTNDVGVRKKKNIDRAIWKMFAPYAILSFFIPIYQFRKTKRGKIKKRGQRRAMYSYMNVMKDIFPYIKPAIPYMDKIANMPGIDQGWYANAKIPSAWVKEKNLTVSFKKEEKRTLVTKRQRLTFSLDEGLTYEALNEQLGRPWRGLDDLTFVEKCCFTIIVPHIFGKTKESRLNNRHYLNNLQVLRAIVGIPDHKGKIPKVSDADCQKMKQFVEKALSKYEDAFKDTYFDMMEFDEPFDPILSSFEALNSEKEMFEKGHRTVQGCILGFRYVKTIMLALFDRSWMYGVLASSELLWVKEFDRDLFYILSQQGRKSCFVEAAGPWAHYLAEHVHGYRMLAPQLYEAFLALDRDFYETHENYTPVVDWSDAARLNKMVPDLSDGNGSGSQPAGAVSLM